MKDIIVRLQVPQEENAAKTFSIRLGDNYPTEATRYVTPRKLLVIAAQPGQFSNFRRLLHRVQVIDAASRWAFGDGQVVVLGGGLCGEGELIEYLWFIYSLAGQAPLAGGRLQFLPGLDELQALQGGWRYQHPQYAISARDRLVSNALYDGNNTLWQWLCRRNFMVKIGRLLITQCGIPLRFGSLDMSIPSLNHYGRLYYTQRSRLAQTPQWSAFFGGDQNPFLFKGYANGEISDLQFAGLLKRCSVDRMITAQPFFGSATGFFRKRMINLGSGEREDQQEGIIFKRNHLYLVGLTGTPVELE